ncbi:hypothetical protein ACJD0Z_00405 [Flavobacteriaceae bacterium M23B6Z8]
MERLECFGNYNTNNKNYRLEIRLEADDFSVQSGEKVCKYCPTVILPLYGKCKTWQVWPFKRHRVHLIIIVLSKKNADNSNLNCLSNTQVQDNNLILTGLLTDHGILANNKNMGVVIVEETESYSAFKSSSLENNLKKYKKNNIRKPNESGDYYDKTDLHNFLNKEILRITGKEFVNQPPTAVGNGGVLKPGGGIVQ